MRFEIVERDLMFRSLAILDQFDRFVVPSVPPSEQCETTLLLNCLMGVVVVHFENRKRSGGKPSDFPEICKNDERPVADLEPEWGLTAPEVHRFAQGGRELPRAEITLRKIVAMFRNAIAHSRLENGYKRPIPQGVSLTYSDTGHQGDDDKNLLESIIMEVNLVNTYRNVVDFRCTIPVEGLRAFVTKLADTILSEQWPDYYRARRTEPTNR